MSKTINGASAAIIFKNMHSALQSPVGATVVIGGKTYDYFAGCGYLGLQNHPQVLASARQALDTYGLSTATSRGGYGEHAVYAEVEQQASTYFGCEKACYFASGYLGMGILVQSDRKPNDHLFLDDYGHYSLWEAAQTTNQPITVFPHGNVQRLEELLKSELHRGERPLVLSDGVFPVSGEIAPVPEYLILVEKYNGILYLDDAHAVGTIGAHGRGTLDYFGIYHPHCHSTGTLSKALGGWGGILWGEKHWVENLECTSAVLSAASPPPLPVAAASARALEIAATQPQLRRHLWDNVHLARQGLNRLGWELEDSPVPILCLKARDGINLIKLRDALYAHGIAVEVVHSYTSSPPGGAIRLAVFASHTREQIERLVDSIRRLI